MVLKVVIVRSYHVVAAMQYSDDGGATWQNNFEYNNQQTATWASAYTCVCAPGFTGAACDVPVVNAIGATGVNAILFGRCTSITRAAFALSQNGEIDDHSPTSRVRVSDT